MGIHTREAATYFLLDCLNNPTLSHRPIAGWDRRLKAYVSLGSEDGINEYLTQFPAATSAI